MKNFYIIFLFIVILEADTCIGYHVVSKCNGYEICGIGVGNTFDSCGCVGKIDYIKKTYEYDCSISIDNIPSVMELKSWTLGAELMNHWFDGNGSTKIIKLDKLSKISKELKDAINDYKQKANNNSIITEDIKKQLIIELKNTDNGQGGKIIPDGGNFDHIATELISSHITGWDNKEDEEKYMHFLTEREIGNDYDLNEFTASIGRGTLRMVAKGSYYNNILTIEKVGVYLRDSYDFIGTQNLGCWSYEEPYVKRISISSDYTCVNNSMFRAYAEYYYDNPYRGQYRIFSDMKIFDTNQTFYLTNDDINPPSKLKKVLKFIPIFLWY